MHEVDLLCATPGRLRLRWGALGRTATRSAVLQALHGLPGIASADVSIPRRRLLVRFDPAVTSLAQLLDTLAALGAVASSRSTATVGGGPPATGARDGDEVPRHRPGSRPPLVSAGDGRTSAAGGAAPRPVAPGVPEPLSASEELLARPRAQSPPAGGHDHDHGSGSLLGEIGRVLVGGAALVALSLPHILPAAALALPAPWVPVVAALGLATGYPFFRGTLRTLVGRQRLDTDTLVSVATAASIAIGETVTALVVIWLLNLGELLQAVVLRRTRGAIRALLVDEGEAWVIVDEREERRPVGQLAPGDVVAAYRGDRLPADGVIVAGEGAINEAPITGEAIPAYKRVGDPVWAGTIVESGAVRFDVQRVGTDTAVGRLIERVEEAEELRAPIATLGERFSRWFVPGSFALAALIFLVTRDARRAMTMLLVACPCAAGLSTPTAVSAAIANAARRGVLIKGGTSLEAAGQIDTIVFDKTGTLTVGQPRVSMVYSVVDERAPEEILALAASGEVHSRHPLALAVVRHAEERALEIPVHEECEILVGQGVRADMRGNRILVGSARLLAQFGLSVPPRAAEFAERLNQSGETPLFVAYNAQTVGVVGIADQLRPETTAALAAVRALGIDRIVMLTGDSPEVAAAVGAQLGLNEASIRARALPEDKYALVDELQTAGHQVAMVGDGINDAPALAAADVGIAMGTAGSEVAIEAADVALASNDIRQIADVVRLGRATLRIIRQNYGLSIGVNTLGIVAGAAGTLNPFLAAVLHNLSSVAVLANSMRLFRYQQTEALAAGTPGRLVSLVVAR
jgi:manganese/zinc-transporting P-type ATPase C